MLAAGLALLLLAGRRRWEPSLAVSLAVAAGLRGAVLVLAAHRGWQPYDFINDFPDAANSVLHHQDPLVTARGWHFLPAMAYVFAADLKLSTAMGVSWRFAGRVLPVVADLVTVGIVGRLASDAPRRRRFQYACHPVPILVACVHGQLEPIAMAFLVGALVAGRARRATGAGALLGGAIAVNSWPVLGLPGLLVMLRSTSARTRAVVAAIAVPLLSFVTIPLFADGGIAELWRSAKHVLGVRPVTGEWGWSAALAMATGSHGALVVSPSWGRIGNLASVVAILAVLAIWRRAHPLDLVTVVIIATLAVTARWGTQYLEWIVPFLVVRPTRWSTAASVAMSAWAGVGYLYLTTLDGSTYWAEHGWWALSSLPVIAVLVIAAPWRRRTAQLDESAGRFDVLLDRAATA